MTLPVDAAAPIRTGEEIDVGSLTRYLRQAIPELTHDPVVQQFRQGHSNLTYLVTLGEREYVLRRPPFGNQVKSAHDMGREYRVLSALAPVFPPAPRPLVFCDDTTVIGAPFYLMERRHGVVIRKSLPATFSLTPAVADALCRGMVTTLAALHRLDHRAIGLDGFGKPAGYIGRQVKGWTDRYRAAETDPVPDIEAVAGWLARHQPPECGAAVIHNDYKFDNVMLDPAEPGRVVAVLDWEMATVGDPLMDLGTTLSYWLEPGDPHIIPGFEMGPTMAPGMWTRRRMVDEYARLSPLTFGDLNFYFVFGIFKLAVVLQQIYARYARGATKDERFATMNHMVAILARGAALAAQRGRL